MNIKSSMFSALLLSGIIFGSASAEAGDRFSVHSCRSDDYTHRHGVRYPHPHPGYRYQWHDYGRGYPHERGYHFGHYRHEERGKQTLSREEYRRPHHDDPGYSHKQARPWMRQHG